MLSARISAARRVPAFARLARFYSEGDVARSKEFSCVFFSSGVFFVREWNPDDDILCYATLRLVYNSKKEKAHEGMSFALVYQKFGICICILIPCSPPF